MEHLEARESLGLGGRATKEVIAIEEGITMDEDRGSD
jgi:hypothetical protein